MDTNAECSETHSKRDFGIDVTTEDRKSWLRFYLEKNYEISSSDTSSDASENFEIMRKLSCPFTWNVPITSQLDCDLMCDRLPLAVTPWDSITKKCHLAYCQFILGFQKRSLEMLVEALMPLLPVTGLETDCSITKLYLEGLRHVLDATSAFIRLASCESDKDRKNLFNFAEKIPSFHSLNEKQRSAIFAIRSQMTNYPENAYWAKEAVKLNPQEGKWHLYLAESFFDEDKKGTFGLESEERNKVVGIILEHNSEALNLRRDAPEPFLLMAELCFHSIEDAYMLVQNAVKKFPENAYVHERSADIFRISQSVFDSLPRSYFLIEPFLKKALKLAGKECLSLRYKLGLHQVVLGKLNLENYESTYDEGISNLKLASKLIPDALVSLAKAEAGTLSPTLVPIPFFLPYARCESLSDDSHVCCETGESSKQRKKSKKKKRKKITL